MKKLVTLLLIGFLFSAITPPLLAKDKKIKVRTDLAKKVVTDEMEQAWMARVQEELQTKNIDFERLQNNVAKGALQTGDTVGFTLRDFSMNTNMGRKIALTSGDSIHVIFTKLETGAPVYRETYDYYDDGFDLFFGNGSIAPLLDAVQTRSGRVINGPNDEAWVSFHDHTNNQTYLANDIASGGYSFTLTPIAAGRFASADYKDGGATWLTTNDADGNFEVDGFYASTDGGTTWAAKAFMDLIEPDTATFEAIPSGVEIEPYFNPATGDVDMVFTGEDPADGTGPFGNMITATTTDLGDTWKVTEIYRKRTVLPDSAYYLVNNFGQVSAAHSSDGTIHVVGNGYGILTDGTSPDSGLSNMFPVFYWNSNMASFEEYQTLTDDGWFYNGTLATNVLASYPGNEIGNAKPGIAVSRPGAPQSMVVAVWSQPERATDSTLVLATLPDGTIPANVFHASDIYGAYSRDNGVTWTEPFYIAGAPAKSDVFPSPAQYLSYDGVNTYTLHLLYLHDKVPGTSVFDGNNEASPPAAWVYQSVDIGPVGIDDASTVVVTDFALAQNYPNPFNPSTTIEYSLKKTAEVTLEVYNLVGQKMVTLVNGRKTAGTYTVNFDAQSLASGVYFYTLSSGSARLTQKMLLLK